MGSRFPGFEPKREPCLSTMTVFPRTSAVSSVSNCWGELLDFGCHGEGRVCQDLVFLWGRLAPLPSLDTQRALVCLLRCLLSGCFLFSPSVVGLVWPPQW